MNNSVINSSNRGRGGRQVIATLTAALIALALLAAPAAAQDISSIAAEVDQFGTYIEMTSDSELDAAIGRANSAGIAFVWLDESGGGALAQTLAESIALELEGRGSRYRTVVVLLEDGFFASGPDAGTGAAADAALSSFSSGAYANGLDQFTATLTDSLSGTTATTQAPSSGGSGSSGFSFGSLLLPLVLVGGGFFLFRNWSNRRKADKELAADTAADKAEIREQLRDNADRVIDLGDRVVLSEDRELIDAYEKASQTYQDVSQSIDSAERPEEVDELDDRIDQAEWQFEMIEAKLEGRPVPPSPAEVADAEAKATEAEAARKRAENSKPALGQDESVLRPAPQPRQTQRRSSYPGASYPGRRRGGMGGGLGGLLGSIVLGGMRGGSRSRRSQRRSGSLGGGSIGGGLGGGVLRPRGSSSGRSGGGGSFGGSRHGGGGDF